MSAPTCDGCAGRIHLGPDGWTTAKKKRTRTTSVMFTLSRLLSYSQGSWIERGGIRGLLKGTLRRTSGVLALSLRGGLCAVENGLVLVGGRAYI